MSSGRPNGRYLGGGAESGGVSDLSTMMFVNLPVADVARSRTFYASLGFRFDAMFCDPGTVCMEVNDSTKVILLCARRFAGYAAGAVAEPSKAREVLLAVSAESRAAVDRRVDAAITAGGTELRPTEDLGFMYTRTFCDPDGHGWEVLYMDPASIPQTAVD